MKTLYLYAIFHANLSFSSIPIKKYPSVIDNCYWPMLELIKAGHQIALEFPSSTLKTIENIDASFIRELKGLWSNSKCDIIGSGFNQNIFPLIPYEVNKHNLMQGIKDYQEILGCIPSFAFVNEQTYCGGLPALYKEAGFDAIIMDWDNASEYHQYPPELRYRPVLAKGVDGTQIPVVWNSSLNSYKFQRCIYGRMNVSQYVKEVTVHMPPCDERALPIYGTDLEIFDYRPLTQELACGEIKKIGDVLSALKNEKGIFLVSPSKILELFAITEKVQIESPESPIPCKNRDDYNVIRWAVSGRDDVWFNTECYKIYNKLQDLSFLSGDNVSDVNWQNLNLLWSSDLRTKTTNEKHYEGKKRLGAVANDINQEYEKYCDKLNVEEDFAIFNPHGDTWNKDPYELEFNFAEGVFFKSLAIEINKKKIPSQCENIKYYKDGSIRSLCIVCLPTLGPYEVVQGKLVEEKENAQTSTELIKETKESLFVKTKEVNIHLSQLTGGDIRDLSFPSVYGESLTGYLSPVYYDHVGHSNDYYTMGVDIVDSKRGIVNDTKPAGLVVDGRKGHFPVRIPIECKIPIKGGIVWKRYYIYHDSPRVDMSYSFYLENISPDFFRLGIVTVNPEAFVQKKLHYSVVNGTPHIEKFPLFGSEFKHNGAVGKTASGHCCLGATEGWVDVSDGIKSLSVITDKSELYSVPMIEYEPVKNSYLLRVYHSISESDETGKIFWRGHNNISFTLLGHRNDLANVRQTARHKNKNLVCICKKKRGFGAEFKVADFVKDWVK